MIRTPKATSVDADGKEDGFVPPTAFYGEADPTGTTRLVIAVPVERLEAVHLDLVRGLTPPIGVLYRQHVDRKNPRPQGAPPKDHVALDVPLDRLLDTLRATGDLVYGDARCDLWLRGALNEQVILDWDGLVYCYPDDPSFRDVLEAHGVPEEEVQTIAQRDYVKHWYHAPNDALEEELIRRLGMVEVPPRK